MYVAVYATFEWYRWLHGLASSHQVCLALLVRTEVGQLRSPIALPPLRLLPYLYALSMLFRPYSDFHGNHASTGLQVIPPLFIPI